MSDTSVSAPSSPDPRAAARDILGAGYALVLVLIGILGMNLPRPTPVPRPDFALTGWMPDRGALAPIHNADIKRLEAHPPGDAAHRVIVAFETLGRIEGEPGSAERERRLRDATIDAANASIDYWFTYGEDAWRGLGTFLMLRFERALDSALAARDVDGATLSRWLVDHRQSPLVRRLRESSGTFVEFALGAGLLSERGMMAGDGPELLRIHFQGRWYLLIQSVRDYLQLYRRDELLAKWRWALEGDKNLSMPQRLEKARKIREFDPNYPVYASLGALYAKRGETLQAIDAYRNALLERPFDARVAKNLRFLVMSQQ